jgi:hypothetical protein
MKLILSVILVVLIQAVSNNQFIQETISKLQQGQGSVFLLKNKDIGKATAQINVNHYIKWITNQTIYPIKISESDIPGIETQEVDLNDTMTWDWMNLKDNQLITQSPKLFKKYLVTETLGVSDFYILGYNNKTHEELATYEPVMVNHISQDKNEPVKSSKMRNLFTLAYLNSHAIKVKRQDDALRVKCIADFYVSRFHPEGENEKLISSIMNEMEKHANFKIAISSSKPSQQQSFVVNEQNQNQNLLPNTTPAPSPSPNSRGQARNFFKPMLNTNQPTQTTTPLYSLPFNQHVPVTDENTNQYRMYQQNLHANPVSSYPVSQGRSEINNYDNNYFYHTANPSIYDFIQLTPIDYPMPVNYVRYNGFQSYMPLVSRIRRDNVKLNENLELDENEEEDDYDSSKFYKVRLSIGPIAIKNTELENEKEEISCTLNIMNSRDEDLLEYSSTIHKRVNLNARPIVTTTTPLPLLQSSQPSLVKEQEVSLQIDSNHKKEVMFLIDSNISTTTSNIKLRKSDLALETIRNKGLTKSDRLLASSSVKNFNFSKTLLVCILMWSVMQFL